MKFAVLLGSVLCSSLAHLLLKLGSNQVFLEKGGWQELVSRSLGNGWLWGGMALHGLALVSWVYALSKVELSVAYPFIALGFVLVALLSHVYLGEVMSVAKLAGMALIVSGVVFVARS